MILQIGNGAVIPDCDNTTYIEMEYFRFKPSISDDVVKASIVISHAGKKFPELSCWSSYLSVSSYSEDGSRNSSKAVDYLKGGGGKLYSTEKLVRFTVRELFRLPPTWR